MQFFTAIALPALAAAGAIVARDSSTVVKDIGTISMALTTLNSSITSFKGDLPSALKIQGMTMSLDKEIESATTDASKSAPFGQSGSQDVASAVVALQPNIASVLNNIVSKQPEFMKALFGQSVDFLVHADLVNLKKDTDYLGGNITAKLSPQLKAFAPLIIANIDRSFDMAITAYSK